MQVLHPKFDLESFFTKLSKCSHSLLILDYDGTLAPFHTDPDSASPYEGVKEKIEALLRIPNTHVIIMSGRRLEGLKKLLRLSHYPELWGCHGGERLKQGETQVFTHSLDASFHALKERASQAAHRLAPHLLCELKPLSVALHWRGVASDIAESESSLVLEAWKQWIVGQPAEIHRFDGGFELRPKGVSKGEAIKTLLKEHPSDAVIAYLGDDFTDEEAFHALGERGLKVLVRESPRATFADVRITPPKELLSFLDRWIKDTE